jgi:hypothetical protein
MRKSWMLDDRRARVTRRFFEIETAHGCLELENGPNRVMAVEAAGSGQFSPRLLATCRMLCAGH